MEIEARLYAGRVSQAHPAHVRRTDQLITIRYTDETGTERIVDWPVSATRLADWSPTGHTRLQFGPFPHQYLDIPASAYGAFMQQGALQPKPIRPGVALYAFMMSRVFMWLLVVGGFLAVTGWLIYAYALPFLSLRAARLVPIEQEVSLGNVMSENLFRTNSFAVDSSRSEAINQYWRAAGIPTRFPIRIAVVQSKEVNAFAIPGGQVVVYSGIFERMQHHEELAALLAHETAHIEQRHTLQQLIRSVLTWGSVSLLFGDISGISAVLIDNADKLLSLSYSRQHESEADAFAVAELARSGIDPRGTTWLMAHLPTEGDVVPSILRSHPQTAARIEATKTLVERTPYQRVEKPELNRLWQSIK
ncbi:TPR repeat-containing protein YPO3069/y1412/YP_2691 [Fibrisoma limi BUZ 3]|uniref:TPR repeat-containing protein YPO3069/y1412/YP_2691 n=1 Tax=Fibrisoma limi BUZ 3 TaxID=1185876 RepID=I2GP67_9BACT|nr:M48 family metallopeptidase [Fibrisoma limi]CCH55695.1 TPR repeat-containing protein YPO3069/y1412/YP_2691 [Fibrisoma limi BUZ 3]